MIVDNSTSAEMLNEFTVDTREVEAIVMREGKMRLKAQYRKGQLKLPCIRFVTHTCKSRNTYLLQLSLTKPADFDNPPYSQICLFDTDAGKKAVMMIDFDSAGTYMMEFEPHLFSRYKERMHVEKDGVELIKQFMKDNSAMYIDDACRKGGSEKDIMFIVRDGIILGCWHDATGIIMKTFISADTLTGRRNEKSEVYDELLEKSKKSFLGESYQINKRRQQ